MKQVRLFFATTTSALCFIINSRSQTAKTGDSSIPGVFEASTPCNDVVKTMLGIPSNTKCELLKWTLSLYNNPNNLSSSTFKLLCVYGLPKQGTRGFSEGAETKEFQGKSTIEKGIHENANAVVYTLNVSDSPISLSFLKAGENLLHLLDGEKHLMVGNGAWSYTFNRISPVASSPENLFLKTTSHAMTDSSAIGVFDGRTPCYDVLRELNGIPANACQIIKCKLTLYQDIKTHEPSTFLLQTIYVGAGDTKYSNTGKWKLTTGINHDPEGIVYELHFDKPHVSVALLKADDNILFFLDKDRDLMVGNSYCSYTLNRQRK